MSYGRRPCLLLSALFLSLVDFSPGQSTEPLRIRLGALVDSAEQGRFFLGALQEAAAGHSWRTLEGAPILFNASVALLQANPVATAVQVCDRLLHSPPPAEPALLHALLIVEPAARTSAEEDKFQLTATAVSYTMGFYRIPIIGLSNRNSAFSDKNVHRSFLRTVPPYFHQADIWVKLVDDLKWKNVIVISSGSPDGRMLLARLQSQIEHDDKDITIERIVEFEAGGGNLSLEMRPIPDAQSRVYLVYADRGESDLLFQQAAKLSLTGAGHVWIVTEQALSSRYCPVGALGLTLQYHNRPQSHMADAIQVFLHASAAAYAEKTLSPPPTACANNAAPWTDGPIFLQNLLKQELTKGQTGHMAFDDMGDRRSADYQLINVQAHGQHVPVGQARTLAAPPHAVHLTLDGRKIVWPGGVREQPKGFIVPNHLKVLTLREAPFTNVESGLGGPLNASWCDEMYNGVICYAPVNDTADTTGERLRIGGKEYHTHCCWGYCIDLLKNLSRHNDVNFTYDLFLSTPAQYYVQESKMKIAIPSAGAGRNASLVMGAALAGEQPQTLGILRELVDGDADMAVAPLTITPEHAKYVEFSKPFKYLGITMLEKTQSAAPTLNSFFMPFERDLWILVMVSLHVVAVCLYLLDRFSPFSRYRLTEDGDPEDDALNMSSAMWFAWGVLLNSGIGEGTPRSFGGRVLGMVWAGFAMIMVASYTANLAAFLVLDRPQTSVSGVNDARLRNPTENFTFATVRGSAVDLYFRRQVELATMYRIMEKRNYDNASQAVEAVKAGKLHAFIWDSARLEYLASQDETCQLITAGELFGRSGYGVALRRNSPWTAKVTMAILGFHETGLMERLDNKYLKRNQNESQADRTERCPADNSSPATLGLQNMAGVFILVGMGIAGGIVLIIIEITYKRQQVRQQRRARLSRMAFDRWRRYVERKRKNRQRAVLNRANTAIGRWPVAMVSCDTDPGLLNNVTDRVIVHDRKGHPSPKRMVRGHTVSAAL